MQGTKPSAVTNHLEPTKIETAAVATDTVLDQIETLMGGFEEEVQSNLDGINIMQAKNDDGVKTIKQRYNEHNDDELDKDKMRQAVLNGGSANRDC